MNRQALLLVLLINTWSLTGSTAIGNDGSYLSPDAQDVQLVINSLPISYSQNSELNWDDIVKTLKKSLSLIRSEARLVESRSILFFDCKYSAAMHNAIKDLPELRIVENGKIGEIVFSPAEVRDENKDYEATVLEALAEIYYRMNEFDQSENYMREALALIGSGDLQHAQRVAIGLAKVLRKQEKFDEAEKILGHESLSSIDVELIKNELNEESLNLKYDRKSSTRTLPRWHITDSRQRLRPAFRSAHEVDSFGKKIASIHREGESELEAEAKAIKGLVLQRLPESIGKKALNEFLTGERAKELERQREKREELRKLQLAELLDEILGITKARLDAARKANEQVKALKEERDFHREYLQNQQHLDQQRINAEREREQHAEEQKAMSDWNEKNRQITGTSYFSRYKN